MREAPGSVIKLRNTREMALAQISVGGSATAGLRLLVQRPLTVLTWGAFLFLFAIVPVGLLFATIAPAYVDFIHQAAASGGRPPMEALESLQQKIVLLNPLIFLLSITLRAVLISAIFRAVLEPEKSRFAYLRLGAQELWVGLAALVGSIILGLGAVCAMIPVILVCVVLAVAHAPGGATVVGFIGFLGVFCAMVWLMVRFSMALPLCFVERRFALFESWDFTKGQTKPLLLIALVLFAMIIAAEIVLVMVVGAIVMSFGAPLFHDPSPMQAFFQQPFQVWGPIVAPWVVAYGVVISLLSAALSAVLIAPWADAYKVLAARHTPDPGVAGLSLTL